MSSEEKTIIDYFEELVSKSPDHPYLTQPLGKDELKKWTYSEMMTESKKMASYIQSLELEAGSRIAICSKNCAWWLMADLAIWLCGHVSVPVYPTLTADTTQYILEHSEAQLLFVGKLDKDPWNEMKDGVPEGLKTVKFPLSPEGYECNESWDDLISKNDVIAEPVKRTMDEMSTIIYTSGSTGQPKGVMHSFRTITVPSLGLIRSLKANDKDRYLSYLPLAHGMERWTAECCSFTCGYQIFFAETVQTFVQDLNRAEPTLFLSVPRLWTKFQSGVFKKMPPSKLDFYMKLPIIGGMVKKKVLKSLGLSKVRYAGSGSAPLPAELMAWYRRLGLELLEGYGMTENFNYSHVNRKGKARIGYVGNTYDDTEHKISEENGEILVKSPGMMLGYYKNEEATKETITEDGWLRTGDRGEIDEKGRLKITGRTKEIFKTSKGKYVAPAPIENKLIVHPKLELACVSGSGQPQPYAVVQLSDDAKASCASDADFKAATESDIETLIADVNKTLDQHEHLQFIAVTKDDWLPENGFLTPTQKIKRGKIEDTYGVNCDEWYGSKKKVVWQGWD